MTLQEALAEVQRARAMYYGTGSLFRDDPSEAAKHLVLNAAVAGDLTPRSDAEQAVALVYDKIAREVGRWSLSAAEEILALAPADALAEVLALKAKVVRLREALKALADAVLDESEDSALCAKALAALGDAG